MLQQATNIQLVGLVHEEAHYLNTEKTDSDTIRRPTDHSC